MAGALALAVAGPAWAVPEFTGNIRLFEISQPNGLIRSIPAVERPRTAAQFYNYSSASSHTGFELRARSLLFLYRDLNTDELALVITHGIDNMGQPAAERQPSGSRVRMDLSGVPAQAVVTQSDDNGTEFGLNHEPEGNWSFGDNTDGGVLSNLPLDEDWAITLEVLQFDQIDQWAYYFAADNQLVLDPALPVTIRSRGQNQGPDQIEAPEGREITVCAFATDDDVNVQRLTLTFRWQDGAESVVQARPNELVCADHTYRDDGQFAIEIEAVNDRDEAATKEVAALITNVAPTVDAGGPYEGTEGQNIRLAAALVADPGVDDTHEVRWDFDGDGVFDTGWRANLAVNAVYPDNGVFEAVVEMRDDDGGVGRDTTTVTVGNADPVITHGDPAGGVVGQPWGLDFDVEDAEGDTHVWRIVAGPEGAAIDADGNVTFTPAEGDVGEVVLVVEVEDDDGGTAQAQVVVVVVADGDLDGVPDGDDNCP
ncbi:MAG: hypothetical protein KC613_00510, partial [Myxococcales bacterium]|nr:hypothetical protein [Myxococcales bacterium]